MVVLISDLYLPISRNGYGLLLSNKDISIIHITKYG